MKSVIYSLHLIMSIGGGLFGLTTFLALEDIEGSLEIALVLVFAALYSMGILGGILFSLNKEKKLLLQLYYILQIPFFSSIIFGYKFFSVCGLYVGYNLFQAKSSVLSVGYHFEYLCAWNISFNQQIPLGMGINLIACILLFLLCKIDYTTLEELE